MLGAILVLATSLQVTPALDKPTGAPLVLSNIETEQSVPLAILSTDHKTASCVTIRLHWSPNANVGPDDDPTDFALDLPPNDSSAPIFMAQLWNASLASAMAWQAPWQGARWKVLQTPATDGSGIDAALAVGMIATSARRPYPKETAVIASLNPDGSLGSVSRINDRLDAAASAGIKRVIIASVQRFDTDASGQTVNVTRHASDLGLECIPVDNLVDATQTVMNDPLPETTLSPSTPKYNNDVSSYIDDYVRREQNELKSGLQFAPKEAALDKYPPRMAAIWKTIYADNEAASQAYRAGQVYVAYQILAKANGRLHGLNALAGQNRITFDVKQALADSDTLRQRVHDLMNPPQIDKGELQSAVLVAEMADWAYDVNAALEGAQLVTKQTFSQRTDATDAEKDRARESLIFAIEQARYLLNEADFYTRLLAHISGTPIPVDQNAEHLLPQLIPAQLSTARLFTDGIRQRANDLRDGLLFDPRLVAYVNVLREIKADWDARQRIKELQALAALANGKTPAAVSNPTTGEPVKLNAGSTTMVGFDPGNTYAPPNTAIAPTVTARKLSDVALCLIWANTDCEIATLDEKYLRLNGTVDPTSHEWHVKDRAKLDALLQAAEIGARYGISFAEKAEVDPSVFAMIYEKAAHLRIQGDDAAALEALRHYWRCALLGNLCWQLAHTQKAQAVDLANTPADGDDKKKDDKDKDKDKKPETADKDKDKKASEVPPDKLIITPPSPPPNVAPVTPIPVTTTTNNAPAPTEAPPRAEAVVEDKPTPVPTPAPVTTPPPPNPPTAPPAPPVVAADPNADDNIPVAPVAKPQDFGGGDTPPPPAPTPAPPATNASPVIGPQPPAGGDNADGHSLP